ncbi:pre-rRNA-processing protein pno1-like [Pyrus communis]|uniref:pre-rRNA-processing protein pno1-like n=1 Tax=Pyrus communis TaxID=23211 RepID=UPI0035BFF7D9
MVTTTHIRLSTLNSTQKQQIHPTTPANIGEKVMEVAKMAFMLGFDVIDAIALLRMDELYVESFEIKDVKTLPRVHLSRAIGRLSGKGGKIKFAIENARLQPYLKFVDEGFEILDEFEDELTEKEKIGVQDSIARDAKVLGLIQGAVSDEILPKIANQETAKEAWGYSEARVERRFTS